MAAAKRSKPSSATSRSRSTARGWQKARSASLVDGEAGPSTGPEHIPVSEDRKRGFRVASGQDRRASSQSRSGSSASGVGGGGLLSAARDESGRERTTDGEPSAAARRVRRVAFGDWQTPDSLATAVVELIRGGLEPRSVLEPTCGDGAFLAAVARAFPSAQLVGFDISEDHVRCAKARLASSQALVEVGDFFSVPWEAVLKALPDPLLIVGNPPWVTNSALGALDARNLPIKANLQRRAGLDALMGRSNFDISESMLTHLLDQVHRRCFCMAVLCKASVARRVMAHVHGRGWRLSGELRIIDARTHFSAEAHAVLLRVGTLGESELRTEPGLRWPVYPRLEASGPCSAMGVVDGVLCSDFDAFVRTRDMEGGSELEWRSGLKHDCSRIMELFARGSRFVNGFGEVVEIESDYVFPLLKGSDIANGRTEPRRAVIVTQRRLSDDTGTIEQAAPRLWAYLESHRERLQARRSRIFRDRPPFAIFGIGDYAFFQHKVAVSGLYKKLEFTALGAFEGRPIMVDDTVYFLSCDSAEQAHVVARALNSRRARSYLEARLFWDAKRPIHKELLQSLSLERLLRAEGLPALNHGR